jgi:hypothetical protein
MMSQGPTRNLSPSQFPQPPMNHPVQVMSPSYAPAPRPNSGANSLQAGPGPIAMHMQGFGGYGEDKVEPQVW